MSGQAEDDIQFIKSTRGRDKLAHKGFAYLLDYTRGGGEHEKFYQTWRCERRKSCCRGRLRLDGKTVTIQPQWVHNHEPDHVRNEALILQDKIRTLAEVDNADPSAIVQAATANTSSDVISRLPKDICRRTVNRVRIRKLRPLIVKSSIVSTLNVDSNVKNGNDPLSESMHEESNVISSEASASADTLDRVDKKAECPSFVQSERGKRKLIFRGFVYLMDKKYASGKKSFWRCEKRKKCLARICFDERTQKAVVNRDHSHEPDAFRIDILKFYELIRFKASTSTEPTIDIVQNAFKQFPPEVSKMVSKDRCERIVRNRRRKLRTQIPENMKSKKSNSNQDSSQNFNNPKEEMTENICSCNKENVIKETKSEYRKKIENNFNSIFNSLRQKMFHQLETMLDSFEQDFFDSIVDSTSFDNTLNDGNGTKKQDVEQNAAWVEEENDSMADEGMSSYQDQSEVSARRQQSSSHKSYNQLPRTRKRKAKRKSVSDDSEGDEEENWINSEVAIKNVNDVSCKYSLRSKKSNVLRTSSYVTTDDNCGTHSENIEMIETKLEEGAENIASTLLESHETNPMSPIFPPQEIKIENCESNDHMEASSDSFCQPLNHQISNSIQYTNQISVEPFQLLHIIHLPNN